MYPDNSVQGYYDPWWVESKDKTYSRGQLIYSFVPHVSQVPSRMVPEGRTDPEKHDRANYRIEPLHIGKKNDRSSLPVAAMGLNHNEIACVYKAKRRPMILLGIGGPEVDKVHKIGAPKWQVLPTILAAPFYGADQDGTRAGFKPELVERIKRSEYPQYMWDMLPIGGAKESILRLDQLQPIGRHHGSIEFSGFCLSDKALEILDDWLDWVVSGVLREGELSYLREELLNI